jgi:hypothetical protein
MTKHSPLLSIYDGQRCVGFVIERVRGFEAYDSSAERSLGIFSTREAAIDSVWRPPDKGNGPAEGVTSSGRTSNDDPLGSRIKAKGTRGDLKGQALNAHKREDRV